MEDFWEVVTQIGKEVLVLREKNPMQFNDVAGKSGLIQQCEINLFGDSPFTQISSNTSRLAIFTNYLNEALARYAQIALMSDYNWEWDDRNQTDLPIGTTALVASQPDYAFSTEHAIVTAVEVKDASGGWHALMELDERFFAENNFSISEYNKTPGTPYQYTKVANSIMLFPPANYAQAASLKVHFKRPPSYYTVADTTKLQGFTDMHATYLSDYATWKYASRPPVQANVNILREEIKRWEEDVIPSLYSKRSAEHSKIIRPVRRSSR